MTDTDKTKEKLVNSIRKTRASAGTDREDKPSSEPSPPPRPSKNEQAPKREEGSYSSGRRVWPD